MLVVLKGKQKPFVFSASIVAVLVLLIGPLYWAATPITYGLNSQTPEAGPGSSEGRGGMGGNSSNFGRNSATSANESLLSYLEENNTGEPYLFAVLDYGTAAPYIVDKGASVVILNGFSNSDTVYTTDTLEALVKSGKVKYFLLSSGGMGGDVEGTLRYLPGLLTMVQRFQQRIGQETMLVTAERYTKLQLTSSVF